MSNLKIYCGNYGSGKTEIALNAALGAGEGATLIDLDLVNPYFTSSEHRDLLARAGVDVVSPVYAASQVDIPAVPAILNTLFDQADRRLIVDVGGTETGAVALGRYAAQIAHTGYEMFLVVNALRPFSSTVEEIVTLAAQIEEKSRLKITALINNTNLQLETTPEMVSEGMALCRAAAQRLGLPVTAVYALPHVLAALPEEWAVRPIRLFTRPEWL